MNLEDRDWRLEGRSCKLDVRKPPFSGTLLRHCWQKVHMPCYLFSKFPAFHLSVGRIYNLIL